MLKIRYFLKSIITLALLFTTVNSFTSYAKSSIVEDRKYAEQLGAVVSKVVERQPQLRTMLKYIKKNGDYEVWFAGGTAVSVIAYAQRLMATNAPIPESIHWFDIFSPGQDADFALGTDHENLLSIKETIENLISESAQEMDVKIHDRSAWEFVTLREDGGRGYVGSKKLFLQSTDTLSLGLFRIEGGGRVDFRYSPEFDAGPNPSNPFLNDIRDRRIRYLRKETHKLSPMVKGGRNPEYVSVLRVINKMSRYGYRADVASLKSMASVVADRLNKRQRNSSEDSNYIPFRALRIARGAMIASVDPKLTSQLFEQFRVYEILKSAGVDDNDIRELKDVETFAIKNNLAISLKARNRVPINKVLYLPSGSIIEGTTLHGGDRPPAMIDRASADYDIHLMKVIETLMEKGIDHEDRAKQLSKIVNEFSDEVLEGRLKSPIHYLSDADGKCMTDCRDYSILAHMLLSEAGVPVVIASTSSNTNVVVELGSRKFVLMHFGNISTPSKFKAEYVQDVWVYPGQNVERVPVDLAKLYFEEWKKSFGERLNADLTDEVAKLGKMIKQREDLRADFYKFIADKVTDSNSELTAGWEVYRGLFPPHVDLSPLQNAKEKLFSSMYGMSNVKDRSNQLMKLLGIGSNIENDFFRVPQDKHFLKLVDEAFDPKNFKFKDADDREIFSERVLVVTQNWTDDVLRKELFLRVLPYVDLDASVIENTRWLDLLTPDPSLLMVARAFDLKGKKFFRSSGIKPYLKFSAPEAIELLNYDSTFDSFLRGAHGSIDSLQVFRDLHDNGRIDLIQYFLQRFKGGDLGSYSDENWLKYLLFEADESSLAQLVEDLRIFWNSSDESEFSWRLPADISLERFKLITNVEALLNHGFRNQKLVRISDVGIFYDYMFLLMSEGDAGAEIKIQQIFKQLLPYLLEPKFRLSKRFLIDLGKAKPNVLRHVDLESTDELIRLLFATEQGKAEAIQALMVVVKQRSRSYPGAELLLTSTLASENQKVLTALLGYQNSDQVNVNDLIERINEWAVADRVTTKEWFDFAFLKFLKTDDLLKISDSNLRLLINGFDSRSYRAIEPLLAKFKDHPYFLTASFRQNHKKLIEDLYRSYLSESRDAYTFLKHLKDVSTVTGGAGLPVFDEVAFLVGRSVKPNEYRSVNSVIQNMVSNAKFRDLLTSVVETSRSKLKNEIKKSATLDEAMKKACQIFLKQLAS